MPQNISSMEYAVVKETKRVVSSKSYPQARQFIVV